MSLEKNPVCKVRSSNPNSTKSRRKVFARNVECYCIVQVVSKTLAAVLSNNKIDLTYFLNYIPHFRPISSEECCLNCQMNNLPFALVVNEGDDSATSVQFRCQKFIF
jgi:hypothetical protein